MRSPMLTIWIFGIACSAMAQSETASDKRDEPAQLPYQQLVKIAHSDSSQPKEKLTFKKLTFTLESNIGIPLNQITLTLQLKKGPLPIPIDPKGQFTIPFSDQLLAENPLMVSNQPSGSLKLKFTLAVPEMGKMEPPKVVDGKVKYQAVFQSLVKLKEAMKKMDSRFGEDGSQQLAVQFVTGGKAITIHQNFGSRTLKARGDSTVWLLYDARLYEENPDISVPEGTEFYVRSASPGKVKEIKK